RRRADHALGDGPARARTGGDRQTIRARPGVAVPAGRHGDGRDHATRAVHRACDRGLDARRRARLVRGARRPGGPARGLPRRARALAEAGRWPPPGGNRVRPEVGEPSPLVGGHRARIDTGRRSLRAMRVRTHFAVFLLFVLLVVLYSWPLMRSPVALPDN